MDDLRKEELFKEFFYYIIKQYVSIRGITYESQFNFSEFVKYLETLDSQTKSYRKYLSYLGIEINIPSTIELDKGLFDSVALDNTLRVSKFIPTKLESLGLTKKGLLIENDEVIIINSNKMVERPFVDTLITHNPYVPIDISTFNKFAQSRRIAIGVYGSIYDKDKDYKLEEMEKLSKKIMVPLDVEFDIDNQNYFLVIMNKQKMLSKNLRKKR